MDRLNVCNKFNWLKKGPVWRTVNQVALQNVGSLEFNTLGIQQSDSKIPNY